MNYEQEKADRECDSGPSASGWQPGDRDRNTVVVVAESDPDRPGIAPPPRLVDYGGILITAAQAARLEEELAARGD